MHIRVCFCVRGCVWVCEKAGCWGEAATDNRLSARLLLLRLSCCALNMPLERALLQIMYYSHDNTHTHTHISMLTHTLPCRLLLQHIFNLKPTQEFGS